MMELKRRAALRALTSIGLAPGLLRATAAPTVPALKPEVQTNCPVDTVRQDGFPWHLRSRLEGSDYRIEGLSPHIYCLKSVSLSMKFVIQRVHDDHRRTLTERLEKMMTGLNL